MTLHSVRRERSADWLAVRTRSRFSRDVLKNKTPRSFFESLSIRAPFFVNIFHVAILFLDYYFSFLSCVSCIKNLIKRVDFNRFFCVSVLYESKRRWNVVTFSVSCVWVFSFFFYVILLFLCDTLAFKTYIITYAIYMT